MVFFQKWRQNLRFFNRKKCRNDDQIPSRHVELERRIIRFINTLALKWSDESNWLNEKGFVACWYLMFHVATGTDVSRLKCGCMKSPISRSVPSLSALAHAHSFPFVNCMKYLVVRTFTAHQTSTSSTVSTVLLEFLKTWALKSQGRDLQWNWYRKYTGWTGDCPLNDRTQCTWGWRKTALRFSAVALNEPDSQISGLTFEVRTYHKRRIIDKRRCPLRCARPGLFTSQQHPNSEMCCDLCQG